MVNSEYVFYRSDEYSQAVIIINLLNLIHISNDTCFLWLWTYFSPFL